MNTSRSPIIDITAARLARVMARPEWQIAQRRLRRQQWLDTAMLLLFLVIIVAAGCWAIQQTMAGLH